MDEFKKYLFDHRDELDTETEAPPGPRVWEHIQRRAVHRKKIRIGTVLQWTAAAVAVILFAAGILWWTRNDRGPQEFASKDTIQPQLIPPSHYTDSVTAIPLQAGTVTDSTAVPGKQEAEAITSSTPAKRSHRRKVKEPVSPLQALENNYASIISYQLKRVERTPIYTENAGYFHAFKKQWLDLEMDEQKIKQDTKKYGLNDEIVDQLIQLYQQKLSVLKQLQTEIDKMNARSRQFPAIRNAEPSYLKM